MRMLSVRHGVGQVQSHAIIPQVRDHGYLVFILREQLGKYWGNLSQIKIRHQAWWVTEGVITQKARAAVIPGALQPHLEGHPATVRFCGVW